MRGDNPHNQFPRSQSRPTAEVTEELVEKELVDPLVDPLEQVVQAAFLAVHRRFH